MNHWLSRFTASWRFLLDAEALTGPTSRPAVGRTARPQTSGWRMPLGFGLLLLSLGSPVSAQSVATVTFTPSTDHSVVAQGVPVVDRYELVLSPSSGPALAPFNLQKPAPASGSIAVNVTTYLNSLPAGSYTAVVRAVGVGGVGVSPASPSFQLVVPVPASPGTPGITRSSGGS